MSVLSIINVILSNTEKEKYYWNLFQANNDFREQKILVSLEGFTIKENFKFC